MQASRTVILVAVAAALVATGTAGWLWSRFDRWTLPIQRRLAPVGPADEERPGPAERELLLRLSAENVLLRTRLDEYRAIRGEGGVPPERVVVARGRVVARSQRAGRRYLELGVGAVDGVLRGQAVCAGWTLVGEVVGVHDGRCLVAELTDREGRVAATVLAAPPATPAVVAEGVLAGTGRPGELALIGVEHRPELALQAGMGVVTAGSDGRFPAGLALGTVTGAERSADGARWGATVVPARDPGLAESLLVVRFPPPGRP